jgi:hypothetical protein
MFIHSWARRLTATVFSLLKKSHLSERLRRSGLFCFVLYNFFCGWVENHHIRKYLNFILKNSPTRQFFDCKEPAATPAPPHFFLQWQKRNSGGPFTFFCRGCPFKLITFVYLSSIYAYVASGVSAISASYPLHSARPLVQQVSFGAVDISLSPFNYFFKITSC